MDIEIHKSDDKFKEQQILLSMCKYVHVEIKTIRDRN